MSRWFDSLVEQAAREHAKDGPNGPIMLSADDEEHLIAHYSIMYLVTHDEARALLRSGRLEFRDCPVAVAVT